MLSDTEFFVHPEKSDNVFPFCCLRSACNLRLALGSPKRSRPWSTSSHVLSGAGMKGFASAWTLRPPPVSLGQGILILHMLLCQTHGAASYLCSMFRQNGNRGGNASRTRKENRLWQSLSRTTQGFFRRIPISAQAALIWKGCRFKLWKPQATTTASWQTFFPIRSLGAKCFEQKNPHVRDFWRTMIRLPSDVQKANAGMIM